MSKQYCAAFARSAVAAHGAPVEDHVVAGDDVRDAFSDRFDEPCGLVAKQERELVVDAALAIVQVCVADTARLNGNDGLTRAGVGDNDRLHRDWRTLGFGNDSTYFLAHPGERIAHAADAQTPPRTCGLTAAHISLFGDTGC